MAAMRGLVVMVAMATTACGAAVAPPVTIGNRAGATGSADDAADRWWSLHYRPARPGAPVVVGLVVDRRTGEPVIGASVVIEHGGTGPGDHRRPRAIRLASLPPRSAAWSPTSGGADVIDRVPVRRWHARTRSDRRTTIGRWDPVRDRRRWPATPDRDATRRSQSLA
ncbi:MAG: hypothetical protein IPH44_04490 [Myxococcales bacterium]|nr:hypothetical protein [Myxococcales bacterium]